MEDAFNRSPRNGAVLKRSALMHLRQSTSVQGHELVLDPRRATPVGDAWNSRLGRAHARDAAYWKQVISACQRGRGGTATVAVAGRASVAVGTPAGLGQAAAARRAGADTKAAALAQKGMSASSQARAAGLLVDKDQDRFERQLTAKLSNVKGIDLDGDGQIDDDELDIAKEMEARLIRSRAFCERVAHAGCPWSQFGSNWACLTHEGRIDRIFRDPYFDVHLDRLNTRLRNFQLTQSPNIAAVLSPREHRPKPQTKAGRRREHEQLMHNAVTQAMRDRLQRAAVDPLSTQPKQYRSYLCSVNPITGKYAFED